MRRSIVARRDAQILQDRSCRNVGAVERRSGAAGDPHAHAPVAALHDERVAFEPEAIGELRQQRIDRREDAPLRDVGTRVCAQRAPVDENGDGRSRWE